MPKDTYQSRREHYSLTPEEQHMERQELAFQRTVNDRRYMTWLQVLKTVRIDRRYQTIDHSVTSVANGRELLDTLHHRVKEFNCTFVTSMEEVPVDYEPDPKDLWLTHQDPETGKTVVGNLLQDPWDLTPFSDGQELLDDLKYEILSSDDADRIAQRLVERRSEERRCDNQDAVTTARAFMKEALLNNYARMYMDGRSHNTCLDVSCLKALEAFDRVYGLTRIEQAGIDMGKHPELRSYQYFFDQGLPPPTHEEMADHIIERFRTTDNR